MESLYYQIVTIPKRIKNLDDDVSRRARWIAHCASFLWFYYSIGVWYGSKFLATETLTQSGPYFLFGAIFIVWFAAFGGFVAAVLVKKTYLKG
jgi:hypothetical protein